MVPASNCWSSWLAISGVSPNSSTPAVPRSSRWAGQTFWPIWSRRIWIAKRVSWRSISERWTSRPGGLSMTTMCSSRKRIGSSSAKEAALGLGRDAHAGNVGAIEQFPVVAVGRAVVQLAVVLDRTPILVLGGDQDLGSGLDLGKIGAHGFDDGQDLVRVNAPHAQVAEFGPGAQRIVTDVFDVLQFGGHVVRRHDAIGQGGGSDFALGAGDQRVFELARALHRAAGNGAMVARDKIHQAEIQRLDAGQGGDLPDLAQGAMGFDQHMDRNPTVDGKFSLNFAYVFDLNLYITGAARLWQCDEG